MARLRHIAFVVSVTIAPLMAVFAFIATLALWPRAVWLHCYNPRPGQIKGLPQAKHGAALATTKDNPANFLRNLLSGQRPVPVPKHAGIRAATGKKAVSQ